MFLTFFECIKNEIDIQKQIFKVLFLLSKKRVRHPIRVEFSTGHFLNYFKK